MNEKGDILLVEFSNKELSAFILYARCKDVVEYAGISRNRFYKLRDNTEFMKRVQQERDDMISGVVKQSEQLLCKAIKELGQIINKHDISPQVKINAVQAIFNVYIRLSEQETILKRIEALEKNIDKQPETF